MSVEEHLSGFAPVEPPDRLRERILALADEGPGSVRRLWWPLAAAAAFVVAAVVVNDRVEARLSARVAPGEARAARIDQPFAPSARLPASNQSWVRLRRTLGKETS